MLSDPNAKSPKILGKMWLIFSAVFLILLLYVAWLFYSRWQANREIEQREAARRAEADRRAVENLGGNRFDILSFYASPAAIRRGDSAQLCYAVSNTKAVRIAPPVGAVWPSYSRCLDVSPSKDTTYTLTAEDAAGHTKQATVLLTVVPKAE